MKGFILTTSFFILTLFVFGQEYRPFNFEKGRWFCDYQEGDSRSSFWEQYYTNGDTIINGLQFKKMFCYSKEYVWYQRDPIIHNYYLGGIRNNGNKQVEYFNNSTEQIEIIYDFNLQIGDTVKTGYGKYDPNRESLWNSHEMPLVLRSIDSVKYCGKYHKRYNFDQTSLQHPQFLIEGIGFYDGFMFPVFQPFEIIRRLECYGETGNPECVSCGGLYLSNNEIEYNQTLTVLPNPNSGRFNVDIHEGIDEVEIYDLSGNLVYKENSCPVVTTIQLDVPNGIYLIKVKTVNDHLFSTKMVVKKEL